MDARTQGYFKDDDRLKEREMIKLALDGLEKVQTNIRDSLLKVHYEMQEVHEELGNTGKEFRGLVGDIFNNFDRIEMMFKNLHWDPDFIEPASMTMIDPGLMCRDLDWLRELEMKFNPEKELMTNLELIKKVKEITEHLERLTNTESDSALETLAEIKEDGKKQVDMVKRMRRIIGESFSGVKELIRSHCTFPESSDSEN